MPSPRVCSSPRHTGPIGLPSAKQEMMSVPPLMLARWTSRLIVCVHVVVAVRRERAAGREDGAERREIVGPRRLQSLLLGQRQILGAGAEHRHPLRADHVPQESAAARAARRRRAPPWRRPPARHQPVPHHPAAGGEVEDPVLPAEIGVQHQLLQVLEQRPAGAVHHALGEAGGAGGVHDVERMVERQAVRRSATCTRAAVPRSSQFVPQHERPGQRLRCRAARRGMAPRRRARSPAIRCAHLAHPRERVDRPCPHSGSRRRRTAPRAGSGRTGRARRWRRSPASRTTRRRPGWRRPASR